MGRAVAAMFAKSSDPASATHSPIPDRWNDRGIYSTLQIRANFSAAISWDFNDLEPKNLQSAFFRNISVTRPINQNDRGSGFRQSFVSAK
jgi:hypothetical protein